MLHRRLNGLSVAAVSMLWILRAGRPLYQHQNDLRIELDFNLDGQRQGCPWSLYC